MTSVFLPLPELKATAAPSAVSGTAASGETSDTFAGILDTVLGETDTPVQNLTDLPGYAYMAATLAPAPETNAAQDIQKRTLTLTPPPVNPLVNPAAVLPSEATASATATPADMAVPSTQPVPELLETFTLPVIQPAHETKAPVTEVPVTEAPVTGAPQAIVAKPDPATPPTSVATPTNITPQAAINAPVPTTSVQTSGQPRTAPDAPALSATAPSQPVAAPLAPQTPQGPVTSVETAAALPAQAHRLASGAPVIQAPVSLQTKVSVDAPVQDKAFTQTPTQSVASSATSSETPEPQTSSPDAPRISPATAQTHASDVNAPQGDKTVTAPAPNMSPSETDLTGIAPNRAPVAPALTSATAPETVTTAVQAALTLPTNTKAPLPAGPLTPALDAEIAPPEGDPLAPADTRAEAQASTDTKTPHNPLVSARSEPAQNTVALKAEPAPDAASAAIAKPDTAAPEAAPPQSPTQANIPATPPAAELAAPRAPLQPALMTATVPPPAPQGSHLSSHTVENIAALSAQITRKLSGKTTQFDMQLKPADQGRVDVRLEINSDGKLSAHLSFDSPISESEFRGRQDELRRQLEQAGFQLEDGSLSFSSRERQSRENHLRDWQHPALPVNDTDSDIPAPLPVHNRPYAGAPVDGLYSSGQQLSLSMLV